MRRALRRLRDQRSGSATLEFALIGSAFITLVLFVLGASLLLWAKGTLQMAASQTARCVAIGVPNCATQAGAQAYANSILSAWGVSGIISSVSVSSQSGTTCGNSAGQFSVVTISGTGPRLVPPLSHGLFTASACQPSGP